MKREWLHAAKAVTSFKWSSYALSTCTFALVVRDLSTVHVNVPQALISQTGTLNELKRVFWPLLVHYSPPSAHRTESCYLTVLWGKRNIHLGPPSNRVTIYETSQSLIEELNTWYYYRWELWMVYYVHFRLFETSICSFSRMSNRPLFDDISNQYFVY